METLKIEAIILVHCALSFSMACSTLQNILFFPTLDKYEADLVPVLHGSLLRTESLEGARNIPDPW